MASLGVVWRVFQDGFLVQAVGVTSERANPGRSLVRMLTRDWKTDVAIVVILYVEVSLRRILDAVQGGVSL